MTSRPTICEMPPIKSSPTHTVLIETMMSSWPNMSKYIPGVHVLMPYYQDEQNFPEAKNKWALISETLHSFFQRPVNSSYEIQERILSYNKTYQKQWRFDVLHLVIQDVLSEEDRAEFMHVTLPQMARLALELPQLLPRPLPLLSSGRGAHVSLSQRQIASLLAHAFFCTYPRRNNPNNQFKNYPTINFNGLYQFHDGRSHETSVAKLLCILNYFKRVTAKVPVGAVTFSRRHNNHQPEWKNSSKVLRLSGFKVHPHGSIEFDGTDMLQVNFANKMIGGGVLDSGSVQEEIRCITCPEMIVTRLFTEKLADNEALLVTGVERYCDYKGYAKSFRFTRDYVDPTPRDESGRLLCSVVAIDALKFSPASFDSRSRKRRRSSNCFSCCFSANSTTSSSNPNILSVDNQYDQRQIDRELNKAYVGFKNPEINSNLSPVATGNWGCGAFNGDPVLKFMLQLLASSQAERDMHFFTFGSSSTENNINEILAIMVHGNYTVGKVYEVLCKYYKHHVDDRSLLEYLRKELRGKRRLQGSNNGRVSKI